VLDKGILRSTIKLTVKCGEKILELGQLPNSLAEQTYGIIREDIGKFQSPFSTGYANTLNFNSKERPHQKDKNPQKKKNNTKKHGLTINKDKERRT
jgi:hypothetical protein